jgi:hypothetical protein
MSWGNGSGDSLSSNLEAQGSIPSTTKNKNKFNLKMTVIGTE